MLIELSVSLEAHLAHSSATHRRLCPRQVLGVRMARFACIQLGIDPAIQRKRLFVYMENGHCIADGVIAVTYASPTNGLMQLLPYGKMAATFVDMETGRALRVREHPDSRQTGACFLPEITSPWTAQLHAYQIMPDELLLSWQAVVLTAALPKMAGKHKVACKACGDLVHEHCEVLLNGLTLCKACADGAYYKSMEPVVVNLPVI
jgi:formylmethanofuran dehydrogenase subunit E